MNVRFVLTPELRRELKKPLGTLIRGELPSPYGRIMGILKSAPAVITVGDVVTENTMKAGITPDLAIYDGRTKRKEHEFEPEKDDNTILIDIVNPPGTITYQLLTAVRDALREHKKRGRNVYIRVHGEEDLAAIPAVIYAPYGGVVLYGQPDEGVVLIRVTPECKRRCAKILASMEVVEDGG
ncbi:MAG: DUF359 domain-containing protein [Thermococci archaeon]|nr:DUF359 domain-containing protein [Thermococci archaeon]